MGVGLHRRQGIRLPRAEDDPAPDRRRRHGQLHAGDHRLAPRELVLQAHHPVGWTMLRRGRYGFHQGHRAVPEPGAHLRGVQRQLLRHDANHGKHAGNQRLAPGALQFQQDDKHLRCNAYPRQLGHRQGRQLVIQDQSFRRKGSLCSGHGQSGHGRRFQLLGQREPRILCLPRQHLLRYSDSLGSALQPQRRYPCAHCRLYQAQRRDADAEQLHRHVVAEFKLRSDRLHPGRLRHDHCHPVQTYAGHFAHLPRIQRLGLPTVQDHCLGILHYRRPRRTHHCQGLQPEQQQL